jgi:hypothetical protein
MTRSFAAAALLLCAASWPCAQDAQSQGRTRSVGVKAGDIVTIEVALSTAKQSLTTVVEFAAEKSVSSIVQAFSKEDVSLEAKQNRLFVKLLSVVTGYVDVVGSSGALYRLMLVKAKDGHDALVRISQAKEEKTVVAKSLPQSLELIRAMRLLRIPEGGAVARASGSDSLFKLAGFDVSPLFVFELDGLKGYICRLVNRSVTESFDLDLSRFEAESLVLVGAKDLRVAPGKETLLYFVFERDEK